MSSQVSNHIQMAIPSCLSSTSGSAVDAVSSQVSNHIHMAIPSCSMSTIGSAVNIMCSQVSNHIHVRSEHTSELQSLMRISYAVFCLKKKNKNEQFIIIS